MALTRALMQARHGAVVAPHYLASMAGVGVLQQGGNAVDAAIAMNATLGVVYPHMTGVGGDAFWLIYHKASGQVHALNGSGRAVANARRDHFRRLGHDTIPQRGVQACVTVPGAVDSWCMAHERFGQLALKDLLRPAIGYARNGFAVSRGLQCFIEERQDILVQQAGTRELFVPNGRPLQKGDILRLPQLAETLQEIAKTGRHGFYEGPVAKEMIRAIVAQGGNWDALDLREHCGTWEKPITTTYRGRTACQHPPNSQGFVHLMLLNILENFDLSGFSDRSADFVHLLVEACKLVFQDRDRYLTDPAFSPIPLDQLLSKDYAAELARRLRPGEVGEDERQAMGQDTTCTAAMDGQGNAVCVIQSLYHEFGSAFTAGETGVLLQNRGSFFSLEEDHVNRLEPGKRSFHTLMPGMLLREGVPELVYGTMGGEGQPQTSTMLVARILDFGMDAQTALDRPRWLYGRTWGDESGMLRLESRFPAPVIERLRKCGHDVEVLEDWSTLTGHAGVIHCQANSGILAAGADARGEGLALGW